MATDLKKMVEDWWHSIRVHRGQESLYETLKAMAAEIEVNRKEIEKLKPETVEGKESKL